MEIGLEEGIFGIQSGPSSVRLYRLGNSIVGAAMTISDL